MSPVQGIEITQCNHSLPNGRKCCRTLGHAGRHSHTWQHGDARYEDIDGKLIDMETGDVVGYTGDAARRVIEEITGERTANPPTREDVQAKARRVLEIQYGGKFEDNPRPCYAAPPKGIDWYYEGTFNAYGRDINGHTVAFSFATGKVQRIYSLNQRRDAVAYARRFGSAKSAEKFDIPSATIRGWISRRNGIGPK